LLLVSRNEYQVWADVCNKTYGSHRSVVFAMMFANPVIHIVVEYKYCNNSRVITQSG